MLFLYTADFFQNQLLKISFMNTRVSNSLYPDQVRNFVGLIWFQTVCKGYQHTTKVAAYSERVKKIISQGIMLYFIKILKIQYT